MKIHQNLNLLSIITLTLLISGCSTLSTKEMQGVMLNNKTKDVVILPQEEDMKSCEPWISLKTKSIKEVKSMIVSNSENYQLCSSKVDTLIQWIKRNNPK